MKNEKVYLLNSESWPYYGINLNKPGYCEETTVELTQKEYQELKDLQDKRNSAAVEFHNKVEELFKWNYDCCQICGCCGGCDC